MRRAGAIAALAVLAFSGLAFADEPRLAPLKPAVPLPAQSLEEVVRASPTCRSFTNGCGICLKGEEGMRCSTPGPVCQPRGWRCGEPAPGLQGI